MRKLIAGILLGLGAAAIILLIAATGVLERVELILYDWRMRRSPAILPTSTTTSSSSN